MGSGSSKKKGKETPRKPGNKTNSESTPKPVLSPKPPDGLYQNPSSMQAAQEEYGSNHDGPPAPAPDGSVPAFPTPDKKADVFNPNKNSDDHATNTPHNYCMKTFPELVSHLTTSAGSDVSKLRVMYKWLTSQHLEDYDINKDPATNSVFYQLLLVRARRKNLNHVLHQMCTSAGIKSKLIQGSTRPRTYYYGGKVISEHVWMAAYVRDAWRLVDAHLALHYDTSGVPVDDHVASPRIHKDKEVTPRKLDLDEDTSLVNFFFLTDPYMFIYFNFPDDANWQLLVQQVSKEMFENLVVLTPYYFIQNIANVAEAKGVVQASHGHASFKVTLPKKHNLRMTYRIRRLVGITSIHKSHGGELKNFCFLQNEGNVRNLNVTLNDIGRYQVTLYVFDASQSMSQKKQICHYFLDVEVPDINAAPLLYNPRLEYGPGADTRVHHIQALSHKDAMIRTSDGKVCIQFRCTRYEGVSLLPELTSMVVSKDRLKHYMLQSVTDDGDLACYIKLPEAGRYLYKLMVQDHSTGAVTNVCSYIIVSSAAYCDGEPYPEGVSEHIGDVVLSPRPWLKATSHPDPMIDLDDSGELSIDMETLLNLDIQTQLELYKYGSHKEDLAEYSWFVHKNNKLEIVVTFPEAGQYSLSVFAKPRGQESVFKHVWLYIVNVNKPHEEALPFPTIHSSWSHSCDLRQPLCGFLQEAKDLTFEVRVPGAKDVAILTDTWVCRSLTAIEDKDGDQGDDWWMDTVRTGSAGTMLNIAALFDGPDYTFLLEYQVIPNRQFQRIKVQQKQAMERARDRLRAQQRMVEAQKDSAELRRGQTEAKMADAMVTFNQEKERLLMEEDIYRRQELQKWKHDHDEVSKRLIVDSQDGLNDDNAVTQQVIDLQESKDANITTRRSIHKGIRTYLVRERLREGTKLKDYDMLKSALMGFSDLGLEEKEQDLTKAIKTMDILQAKQDLLAAMKKNEANEIRECVDNINKRGLYGPLQASVQEAERLLIAISKVDRLKRTVLGMDKNTMGEIRSYSHPPEGVHQVMQAALLLLGEDEFTTSEWINCQKMCSLVGRESISRRILDLNITKLNPEILSRVDQILSGLDLKQVQYISAGAATFYVWAMGTVEEAEKINSEGRRNRATPANISRQREIFNRTTLEGRDFVSFGSPRYEASVQRFKEWIP